MRSLLKKWVTFIITSVIFSLYSAQLPANEWKFSTGLALSDLQQAWIDSNSSVSVVPVFSAEYGRWHFIKNGIVSYRAYQTEDVGVNIGVSYRDLTYNAAGLVKHSKSDNKLFDGYDSPDGDFVLTVNGSWKFVDVSLQQDVSGSSDALSANLGVQLPLINGEVFSTSVAVGVSWLDKKLVNHSFGIPEEQSNINLGRTVYVAESAFNYQASITSRVTIDKDWNAIISIGYEKYDKQISDSPLLGKDYVSSATLALIYSF